MERVAERPGEVLDSLNPQRKSNCKNLNCFNRNQSLLSKLIFVSNHGGTAKLYAKQWEANLYRRNPNAKARVTPRESFVALCEEGARRDWMLDFQNFWKMSQSNPISNCGRRCVRQVGLLSTALVDSWEDLLLVREDRSELTSGVRAVLPRALLGSYVGNG